MQAGKLCRNTLAGVATSGKVKWLMTKSEEKSQEAAIKKGSRVAEPSRATSRATQDGLATAGWALLRYAGNNVQ